MVSLLFEAKKNCHVANWIGIENMASKRSRILNFF